MCVTTLLWWWFYNSWNSWLCYFYFVASLFNLWKYDRQKKVWKANHWKYDWHRSAEEFCPADVHRMLFTFLRILQGRCPEKRKKHWLADRRVSLHVDAVPGSLARSSGLGTPLACSEQNNKPRLALTTYHPVTWQWCQNILEARRDGINGHSC